MNSVGVRLVDLRSGEIVAATLQRELDAKALIDAEVSWRPYRNSQLADDIERTGGSRPEHFHWNWANKAVELDRIAALSPYECLGIECQGEMQGMMMINTTVNSIALESYGKPLIYVEFIESAPWNLRAITEAPRFGGVGHVLIRAAIEISVGEEFKGRIGLHSLPQSNSFYADKLGMTPLEAGRKSGMTYFEMTEEQARKYLSEK